MNTKKKLKSRIKFRIAAKSNNIGIKKSINGLFIKWEDHREKPHPRVIPRQTWG